MNDEQTDIRGVPVYHEERFSYIRISETPEAQQAPLKRWLVGQTIPFVADLDPMDAIYSWDYERFLAGRPVID